MTNDQLQSILRLLRGDMHIMEFAKCLMKSVMQKLFFRFSNWLCNRLGSEHVLPVGGVHFGNLRRIDPISRNWGYDRGLPIDRYYIEAFLSR